MRPDTAIKFMTDGVLLREVSQDIALRRYSAIIIDEAHERTINTDILLGIMSRVCKLRTELHQENGAIQPLKLVIMSATLRLPDLIANSKLFPEPPPVVDVEGRQHPVTLHFARRTQRDYLDQAYKKIIKGHDNLPPGGMLVFLTGQDDIKQLQRRLEEKKGPAGSRSTASTSSVQASEKEDPAEAEDYAVLNTDYNDALRVHDLSDSESEHTDDEDFAVADTDGPLQDGGDAIHVLPLYSLLSTDQQMRVFDPPPPGSRLIVLATNIAETSLTIPNIRYVFDCGRAKQRKYDRVTGVQSFEVSWISKASAMQRSGRAGRTGPGHCYRLYSSALYERDFDDYAEPEIRQMPIEGVVLQLKAISGQNIQNFPFPTAPDPEDLKKAEELLGYLGALDARGNITTLGRAIMTIPVSPRFARILAIGHQRGCLQFIIAIVSALSVNQILLTEAQVDILPKSPPSHAGDEVQEPRDMEEEERQKTRRRAFKKSRATLAELDHLSDALQLLSAVCASAHEPDLVAFCRSNFLNHKAILEVDQLRRQITDIIRANPPALIGAFEPKLPCLPRSRSSLSARSSQAASSTTLRFEAISLPIRRARDGNPEARLTWPTSRCSPSRTEARALRMRARVMSTSILPLHWLMST